MNLRKPRPAQEMALAYALPKSRIALFMEMRLGKNLVVIRWARHHERDRVLVVAPNDTLDDWADELVLEGVDPRDIEILTGSRIEKLAQAEEIDTGWAIVNYEALRHMKRKTFIDKTGAQILELPWSAIILDESPHIRNPRSSTSKVILGYTPHITHRAILTGLPNPQSEMDFFTQMAFKDGSFMGFQNFWIWRNRCCIQNPGGWGWSIKKEKLPEIRRYVHQHAFFLSRKDAGVGEYRTFERRYVQMSSGQRTQYRKIERDFAFTRDEDEFETKWATVQTTWLARVAGGFLPDQEHPRQLSDAKQKALVSLLCSELAKEQVVVWFRFNQELRAVEYALELARIPSVSIVGGKDRKTNYELKKQFQTGKARVILMQIKMGKYGWDLSASSTAIYYSNSYDWEERAQSQDRIVNIGKHEPLLIIDLITKNTIDEQVVRTLTDKKINAHIFNSKLKERLRASWDRRYRRVMPGDR